MRKLAQKLWGLVRGQERQSKRGRKPATRLRWRPVIEALEDRLTPATAGFSSANAPGVVTGVVYLNPNNQAFDAGDTIIPGVSVSLTGSTTQGTPVNVSTTTDATGTFTFFQVAPGTYSLTEGGTGNFVGAPVSIGNLGGTAGNGSISLISVAQGQTGVNYNFSVAGFAPGAVSLRQFLSSTKGIDTTLMSSPGAGNTAADNSVQPPTAATAGTASLGGSVLDSGNHGIANVQLSLTGIDNTGRDIMLLTTTDATGAYQFSTLNAGIYTVNVTGQPAGFEAAAATAGQLGGQVFRNDQITNISVTAGAAGKNYNFSELPIESGIGAGLAITAALADDTLGPGGTKGDGLTSDPSIEGSIVSAAPVVSFQAGFDSTPPASFANILSELLSGGVFFLNPAFLAMLAGGTLADGAHVIHLRATNAQGQTSNTDVAFTLDTDAPQVPTLHMDATSDPGQIGRTTSSTVTLQGVTSPGDQVELSQGSTNTTTTADSTTGAFSFSNVTLTAGANSFTVQAADQVGNVSQLQTFFVLESPPVAVPTSPVAESLTEGQSAQFVDLSSPTLFKDGNIANTVIRFDTSAGPINLQLDDTQAPQTVANFLSYVENGSYTNDIFHRLVNNFVLQGGGFTLTSNPSNVVSLTAGPSVPSEADNTNRPAVEGTIAMALSGNGTTTDNNSATDEFFFNLVDNTSQLSTSTNTAVGDFTVFGKVVSGADQRVINTLAADAILNEQAFNPALSELPMKNYSQSDTAFPTDTTAANFALINDVSIVQQTDQLTFTVVSNLNASNASGSPLVTASIVDGQLKLSPVGIGAGTETVVVQAQDRFGNTAKVTFNVTVASPVTLPSPGTQTPKDGDVVSLQLNGSDSSGSTLTYSITGGTLPPGLSLAPSTGLISGTVGSAADDGSPYTTTITATDTSGFLASQTITWNVSPVITVTPPSPAPSNLDTDSVNLQINAVDQKGLAFTFTAAGLPQGLSISLSGLITGTPTGDASTTPYNVTVTATDTGGFTDTIGFQWTISAAA
jgi:cyclophilin family peptidyl-prolyl cis-trans isomerase